MAEWAPWFDFGAVVLPTLLAIAGVVVTVEASKIGSRNARCPVSQLPPRRSGLADDLDALGLALSSSVGSNGPIYKTAGALILVRLYSETQTRRSIYPLDNGGVTMTEKQFVLLLIGILYIYLSYLHR